MNYGKQGVKNKRRALNSKSVKWGKKLGITIVELLLIAFIAVVIIGASAGIGMFKGIIATAPDISNINVTPSGYSTFVYDNKGNQIAKSAAMECLVDELKYGDYYSIDYSKQSENYDYEYDGYYDYIYFIKANEPDGIGNYNIASAKAKTALRQFVEAHKTELDMIYNVVIE